MNNDIVPAIVQLESVREFEAIRLANELYVTADANTIHDIAVYGECIERGFEPPRETMVTFYHTVYSIPLYAAAVAPMKGFDARLEQFENHFALEIYRLKNAEE